MAYKRAIMCQQHPSVVTVRGDAAHACAAHIQNGDLFNECIAKEHHIVCVIFWCV